MLRPNRMMASLLVLGLAMLVPILSAQEAKRAEREAMYEAFGTTLRNQPSLQPHWMADNSSFWYAEGGPANTVIYKVDPMVNTKTPLFEPTRLRKALTPILGYESPSNGLPFEQFTFVDGEKAVRFAVDKKEFVLQLNTYSISRAPVSSEAETNRLARAREMPSPDQRWIAGVKDYNIYLRSTDDGRTLPLTSDGIKGYNWDYYNYFAQAKWSPDSQKLAVMKMDVRKVGDIPFVHWLKPQVDVEWVTSSFEGPTLETNELFIVDALTKRQVRVNTGGEPDQRIRILGWQPDGSALYFLRAPDPLLKEVALLAADPETGAIRVVVTEAQKTFVGGYEGFFNALSVFPSSNDPGFRLLRDGKTFLWLSERDGWNHLYLYRGDGTLIRRLTEGRFPVIRVAAVDENSGWVYFTAHGQRPYDIHLYRVTLEGKSLTRLTEAAGYHQIAFAPSKDFFTDWHTRVDRPGVFELRRADGRLLQTLSRENVEGLDGLQWQPPDEFVVKAADGKTDLNGVLYKPYNFDSRKKYPVIDVIYADNCCLEVPFGFAGQFSRGTSPISALRLAQLGFVTFIVDGRGTPGRGKEFKDLIYGNRGRIEIPDHVATLKQLAQTRPYMDLSRVGVTGNSSGGYFALRAMLLAPDVYQVGVAVSADGEGQGSVWPLGPIEDSNLSLVPNLKGKLLLIEGTGDAGFSDTMRKADAFIRAGKFFDLIVLPEGTHGSVYGSPYVREAIRRYFQEHLKPE